MATLTVPLLSLVSAPAQAQAQALPALRSSTRVLCTVSRVGGSPRRFALSKDDVTSSLRTEESCSGRSGEEVRSSELVMRVSGASALAVAASLASACASLADEVAASAPVDGDAGISTTVSVLFVLATVGLVVLTGGVVYLGLTEFLEKRALEEEQKKAEAAKPKKEKSAKQAVKAAARTGGPKGFGSGNRAAAKGDDESSG